MIGIGITSHNRPELFAQCFAAMQQFAPPGAIIVVVDDASDQPVPGATHRFEKNVGIASAKNKCFELLYNVGCDHFFLFDDDTWPIMPGWWEPYVNASQGHLAYIFLRGNKKTQRIGQYGNLIAYTHSKGCMLYYRREILEKVGGMDTAFGRYGFEHLNHSDRIFNAGLTRYKFADAAGSAGLFYSHDEQAPVRNKSLPTEIRQAERHRNRILREQKINSKEYKPFS